MKGTVFSQKIKDIIEACSYNFFIVQQDENFQCSCVNHSTKQPDATCKKCLGTGYKVKKKKIRGACNEKMIGGETLSKKTSRITKTFYVDCKYDIYENNLIIDNNEIYYIYRTSIIRGIEGIQTHKEITSVLKTENHDKVLKNFLYIINKKITPVQKGDFPWLT